MKKWNKFTHKILPFILIGVIASTTVSLNYNKIREVKAVAVVDDALVVAALLAMCGIAWTSASYYWAPGGGWVDDNDSNVLTPEGKEWADGFNDLWQKGWDEQVKKKALELGLIDESGNIINSGGGSSGDDNDDHNFPSWDELKTMIANNKGKIGASMAFLSPFVALYGYSVLEDTKKKSNTSTAPDSDTKTSCKVAIDTLDTSKSLNLSSYNSTAVRSDLEWHQYASNYGTPEQEFVHKDPFREYIYYFGKDWYLNTKYSDYNPYVKLSSPYNVSNGIEITVFQREDGQCKAYITDDKNCGGVQFRVTVDKYFDFNVPYIGVYPDGKGENGKSFVNTPDSLSKNSSLDDYLKQNNNQVPSTVLNDSSRIPTNDEFSKYLQDLNKAPSEDDKQKVIDDFINKITTPSETPTPDPKPDPSNPTPTPNPDTPDNPDSDNDFSVRDLRLVFPFCIPFDLVDCFRLFNSEPETPRVQFPVHFGIVDKDYTFDIDLKDFNNVALVCRSMFLILYIVGLVLATRSLIRG